MGFPLRPTLFKMKVDGDDEDLMGIEKSSNGRRDPGAVHRAAERHKENGECPVSQEGLSYNTQHMIHDVRDYWRNQSYSALNYQQEQFENAVPEHLWV